MVNAHGNSDAMVQPLAIRAARATSNGIWLALASFVSYKLSTHLLAQWRSISRDNELLGGMWAVVATVFVFRETSEQSAHAAVSRVMATSLSFALCLLYLLLFPFHAWGLAVVIGVGSVVLSLIGKSEEIITTGITSAVILVVAAIDPEKAWRQPILRLIDTLLGIVVGIVTARAAKTLHLDGRLRRRTDRRP